MKERKSGVLASANIIQGNMEKEVKTVRKTVPVRTNIADMESKVKRLNEIIEEASSLIEELASMDVVLEIDV